MDERLKGTNGEWGYAGKGRRRSGVIVRNGE